MRILLDTCIWGGVKPILEAAGHDVIWSADWPSDPGDEAILVTAHNERRICVTLDKDFGEFAILHGFHHHGIIRLVDLASREQSQICLQVLDKYAEELLNSAIVTSNSYPLPDTPPTIDVMSLLINSHPTWMKTDRSRSRAGIGSVRGSSITESTPIDSPLFPPHDSTVTPYTTER